MWRGTKACLSRFRPSELLCGGRILGSKRVPLRSRATLELGHVRNGLANSRFHTLLFGINRLRSAELPHWAKDRCSGALVQLLRNQKRLSFFRLEHLPCNLAR
jgi:hypothetical protein